MPRRAASDASASGSTTTTKHRRPAEENIPEEAARIRSSAHNFSMWYVPFPPTLDGDSDERYPLDKVVYRSSSGGLLHPSHISSCGGHTGIPTGDGYLRTTGMSEILHPSLFVGMPVEEFWADGSEPGNELAELLWENGPAFRRTAPYFPAAPFPPFTCSATGTSRAQELIKQPALAVMRDLDLPVHDDDDDDAVPWLHYPIIDGDDGGDADTAPLAPDYCPALLSRYSDLPAAPAPVPATVASRDAREPSSSHGAVVPTTTGGVPPPESVPKKPRPSGEDVMNFTFFSKPLQRLPGGERASAAATASNPVESTMVQTTTNRLRNTPLFSEQRMAWLQPPKGSRTTVAAAPPAPLVPCRQGETAATVTQRLPSEARAPEPVAAAATTLSVCSGNSDRSQLKRSNYQAVEWSLSQDEDLDDEPNTLRRSVARSTKRSRIAEVHNLSERRRRDRINEKMRALQELIPNCNKIDKASMLEEAIEYLKTLQLQVQMMSMGTGLYVPPMLLPAAAMQHLQMPPMAHFPHLGTMGLGFGMGTFDMVPFPRVASAQFPCPMIPGAPMAMPPGSATVPMFGLPGQAMPSLASFPPAPGHMANALQAEQMLSEAAMRGGAEARDHSQFPIVPQGDQKQQRPKNT